MVLFYLVLVLNGTEENNVNYKLNAVKIVLVAYITVQPFFAQKWFSPVFSGLKFASDCNMVDSQVVDVVEKEVYGIYELYQLPEFPKEVYICESMLDCLYLWTIGKYACALNGLGCEKQYEQLTQMPCRTFILATDNDEAGKKARIKIRKMVKNKIFMDALLPPNRKDINECTLEELKELKVVLI